ncbi:MAG: catalase [Candidatus Marinimicrobia bacterium]|nr:catalase [Candidatus Neomarinimicrobiota bacterium]
MAFSAISVEPPFPGIAFSQAATPTTPPGQESSGPPQLPGEPEEAATARTEQAGRSAPEAGRDDQPVARVDEAGAAEEQGRAENEERRNTGLRELTPEEKQRVAELKAIDQRVRAHEQAHLSAAGGLARSGPSFSYITGPDGRRYAVGGEVQIDTSGVPNDPEATISKAQNIRRAALAPANPSSQDRNVAARATQLEFEARAELAQERVEETREQAAPQESAIFALGQQLPTQSNLLDQFA